MHLSYYRMDAVCEYLPHIFAIRARKGELWFKVQFRGKVYKLGLLTR